MIIWLLLGLFCYIVFIVLMEQKCFLRLLVCTYVVALHIVDTVSTKINYSVTLN